MKACLVLLILVLSVFAQKEDRRNVVKGDVKGKGSDKEEVNDKEETNDSDIENDYGNPDIYGLIERPCPQYDRFCIRGFFAKNSHCKIVPGPVEEPFYVTEIQVYASHINVTATTNDSYMKGVNGLIQDFYINKATGNLVLRVFFEGVNIASAQTYFRFFRNGREAVEASDVTDADYKKLTVTIVIPNYKNLRLDDAEITGYLDDPLPLFFVGPKVVANPDPAVQATLREGQADIPTGAKANLLTVAPLVGNIFVQKNICDFGVPVNKIGFH